MEHSMWQRNVSWSTVVWWLPHRLFLLIQFLLTQDISDANTNLSILSFFNSFICSWFVRKYTSYAIFFWVWMRVSFVWCSDVIISMQFLKILPSYSDGIERCPSYCCVCSHMIVRYFYTPHLCPFAKFYCMGESSPSHAWLREIVGCIVRWIIFWFIQFCSGEYSRNVPKSFSVFATGHLFTQWF